jgi:hypothetical protein
MLLLQDPDKKIHYLHKLVMDALKGLLPYFKDVEIISQR